LREKAAQELLGTRPVLVDEVRFGVIEGHLRVDRLTRGRPEPLVDLVGTIHLPPPRVNAREPQLGHALGWREADFLLRERVLGIGLVEASEGVERLTTLIVDLGIQVIPELVRALQQAGRRLEIARHHRCGGLPP
jgi:hypothetical protein